MSLLALRPGDVAFDVGCGTGLSFELIEAAIGPTGKLIGVELSPDMLSFARDRVERWGWRNVTLINAPAEDAVIPVAADAVFSFLTHDIMRSPEALENVLGQTTPGARVAVFGAKLPPWWLFPLYPIVWLVGRPYVTTFEGVRRPWSHLVRHVPDLRVRSALGGAAYLAWGRAQKAVS